jgi:hypothetical protein
MICGAYRDESGRLHAVELAVDASGRLLVSGGDSGGAPAAANLKVGGADVSAANPVPMQLQGAVAEIEFKNDTGNPIPVTGPLTEAQLRAAAVSVSGPLTNAELLAVALAKEATQQDIRDRLPLALGAKTRAQSLAVALPSDQGPLPTNAAEAMITGPAAQSALNVDLLTGVVNGWLDVSGYKAAAVQVIASAGITAGQITFEQTNDTTLAAAGVVTPVMEPAVNGTSSFVGGIGIAANTARIFLLPINTKFVRVRLNVAFAGGTVQAVAKLSATNFAATTLTVNFPSQQTMTAQAFWLESYAAASATSLAASAVYSSAVMDTNTRGGLSVFVRHEAAGVPGTLYVDEGADAAFTAQATTRTYPVNSANAGRTLQIPVGNRYARVRFANGTTAQTAFRIDIKLTQNPAVQNDFAINPISLGNLVALAASAAYTSPALDLGENRAYQRQRLFVKAQQAGTLAMQESADNLAWDTVQTLNLTAGVPQQVESMLTGRFQRFVHTNGATAQTVPTLLRTVLL